MPSGREEHEGPAQGESGCGTDGMRVARAYGSRALPGDGWLSRNVVGEIISPAMPLRGLGSYSLEVGRERGLEMRARLTWSTVWANASLCPNPCRDAVVLRRLDFDKVSSLMATSRIVDTGNMFDFTTIRRTGYSYTEEKASYENGLSCLCRDECHLLRSVFVPVGFTIPTTR
jgi:hypothetical protein